VVPADDVPHDDVGVVTGADPSLGDVELLVVGTSGAPTWAAPAPVAAEVVPVGRWPIASSCAARRSEKQYRHLIASSWIISAQ
jgi:hypothetical protein